MNTLTKLLTIVLGSAGAIAATVLGWKYAGSSKGSNPCADAYTKLYKELNSKLHDQNVEIGAVITILASDDYPDIAAVMLDEYKAELGYGFIKVPAPGISASTCEGKEGYDSKTLADLQS
jgi:hypothetical protein